MTAPRDRQARGPIGGRASWRQEWPGTSCIGAALVRAARGTCSAAAGHVAAVAWVAILAACAPRVELAPVPVPDATTFEPAVRTRLATARAAFDRSVAARPEPAQLADAYGELAMTYHAQGLVAVAEVAYANARKLAPRDRRWAYLLGHVYADESRTADAIDAFTAARSLDPADAPTLIHLGRLYLKAGRPDEARPLFEQAMAIDAARAAAVTGLGKVALEARQYREAAGYFEQALRLAPGAARLRQPLALAYRGLGREDDARTTLQGYAPAGLEPGVEDPLLEEVEAKAAAYRAVLARGQRAGKAGRYDAAERIFRAAVSDDPANAEALVNLGVALANLGRLDESRRGLEEALHLDASSALAYLTLGMVLDRQGQDAGAIDRYAAALRLDPTNAQAGLLLADACMRSGRTGEALRRYRDAVAQPAQPSGARLALAMAALRAQRFQEAIEALEAALAAEPRNPDVLNALARILATAPDAALRDGPRAVRLSKALLDALPDPVVMETHAMALAESGNFDDAQRWQREAIDKAKRPPGAPGARFSSANLALYQRREAAREPWPADDAMFRPRRPEVRLAGGAGGGAPAR